MASSKEFRLVSSGGVLAAALGAAVVAAILLNVYVHSVETKYTAGHLVVLRLKEDVPAGAIIEEKNVEKKSIPDFVADAFKLAMEPKDLGTLRTQPTTRAMAAGEYLWAPDFVTESGLSTLEGLTRGYTLFTIPINSLNAPGQQLHPGDYVDVYGEFDTSTDSREDYREIKQVMGSVQVKALGGSAESLAQKPRSYNNVQIMVKKDQVGPLLEVQGALKANQFIITLVPRPESAAMAEPQVSKEVRDLVARIRAAGVKAP